MGNYNPHAPYILGQEWVPIRNAHYSPDATERGYTFRIDAVTVPVSGAFYVQDLPSNTVENACEFISVYPGGRETLSGPIKSVTIPASAVAVTVPGGIDISEGVAALLSPIDAVYILFFTGGAGETLEVNFDTQPYAALLLGKRILDVRLKYSFISDDPSNGSLIPVSIINPAAFSGVEYVQQLEMTNTNGVNRVSTLSLGEITPVWDPSILTVMDYEDQRTVLPWRFQELNRFRVGASSSDQLVVALFNGLGNATFAAFLNYLALEVLYCEETRVLYGGFRTTDLGSQMFETYRLGAIPVRMYNPVTHTQGATLTPGDYTVTIYHKDLEHQTILRGAPKLHAVREYYGLPNQRGVWINQTLVTDDAFTSETTDVLTQVTLHTASQIVTGVHPYGTSYGAPVYGSRTVTQEIEDNPADSGSYPQVRFYARRYGMTTVPLTLTDVATGTRTALITVADFDALPEIVDGWREVTLRFATAPTFPPTTDDVDWRWQATGELPGNQWQVMIADGPTGAWGPSAAAAATGPATYWAPLGSSVGLTWQSPTISGTAFDTSSDAVLIFSQDPPAVTGFGLSVLTQTLAAATRCATTPACVPTALTYLHATWQYGTACVDELNISISAVSTDTGTTYDLTPNQRDVIVRGSYTNMIMPVGGNFEVKIAARYVDSSNLVEARLFLTPAGTVSVSVRQLIGGVETNGGFPAVSNVTSIDDVNFIFYVVGTSLKFKAWRVTDPEPVAWTTTLTTSFLTAGDLRLAGQLDGSVTNTLPVIYAFNNVVAVPPAAEGTYLEIQRSDDVDTEWQTVMLTTLPCPSTFDDYEARVGVPTRYRIRTLNALDFAGPWVTGSGTIPAPGATVTRGVTGLLTFTSNAQPTSNLAYVMQFEGQPVEQFSFPEADAVSLQRVFGRDFFVAVHPLERGGEQFERVILVNNAAIALPSLANFRGMRDLAWADLDYVCVRDELGNRWFASVVVPAGEVRGDRVIYMARIIVTQVTNTPSPVVS